MPVYKDKNRNTWYFAFNRVINGHRTYRKGRGYSSKIEAQKAEYVAINELENPIEYKAKDMRLKDLADLYFNYQKTKIKITTIQGKKRKYTNHISYLDNKFLSEISNKLLFDWKNDFLKKDLSESFTNQTINLFKSIINFGIKKGYISNSSLIDELERVSLNKLVIERQVWSLEEFKKFLSTFMLDIPKEALYHDYFAALFLSGMRPNEFRALTKADIQGNYLCVNKSITSKIGDKDLIITTKNPNSIRKVIMPEEIILKLKERCQRYKDNEFIFGKEKALRETNIRRELVSHAKASGLKHIPIYSFRHSHATHLIRSGVPIKVVSKRLGHKDASTTMNTYWHLFTEDETLALEALKMA